MNHPLKPLFWDAGIALAILVFCLWMYSTNRDDTFLFVAGWGAHMLWAAGKSLYLLLKPR